MSSAKISLLSICCLSLTMAHPHQQAYQPLRQYQVPAATRLLPNNVNDGVRYGQQPVMYLSPGQQYLFGDQNAAQDQYLESLLYPSQQQYLAGESRPLAQQQYLAADNRPLAQQQYLAADSRPLAQPQPFQGEIQKPERLQALAQQQLYLEQQAAAQEQMQLMQEEAERQKYLLQFYQQQRPNSNFVYYSLPQQQVSPQASPLADRIKHHGLRPAALGLQSQRYQIRSGQEQNNASSEVQESQETTQPPQSGEEVGPSIAQAKPQAISVAGPGGVAAAAPVGTAVVGPGGMALSAPSATALAGTKPKPGQGPTSSKIRQAVRYLY